MPRDYDGIIWQERPEREVVPEIPGPKIQIGEENVPELNPEIKGLNSRTNEAVVVMDDFTSYTFERGLKDFAGANVTLAGDRIDKWRTIANDISWAVRTFTQEIARLDRAKGWTGKTHDKVIETVRASLKEPEAALLGAAALSILLYRLQVTVSQTRQHFYDHEKDYADDLEKNPTHTDQVKAAYNAFAVRVMSNVWAPNISAIAKHNPEFSAGGADPPADLSSFPPVAGSGGLSGGAGSVPSLSDFPQFNGSGGFGGGAGSVPSLSDFPQFNGSGGFGGGGGSVPSFSDFPSVGSSGGFGGGGDSVPNLSDFPQVSGSGIPGLGETGNSGLSDLIGPVGMTPGGATGGGSGVGGVGKALSGLPSPASTALSPVTDAVKQALGSAKPGGGVPGAVPSGLPKGFPGLGADLLGAPHGGAAGAGGPHPGGGGGGPHAGGGGPQAGGGGAGLAPKGLEAARPMGAPIAALGNRAGSPGLSTGVGPVGTAAGAAGGGPAGGGGGGAGAGGGKEHKSSKALRSKNNGELVMGEVDAVVPVIGDDGPATEVAHVPESADRVVPQRPVAPTATRGGTERRTETK